MRHILNISLPKEMITTIKKEVREGGFATVSEFMRHLIRLYKSEMEARRIKRDHELFKKGKLKVVEVKSFRDVLK